LSTSVGDVAARAAPAAARAAAAPRAAAGATTAARAPATTAAATTAARGPTTASEMNLPRKIWRDAMKYARDVRNRWSFLDLADDAGLLDDFLSRDPQ